jgi:transcription antitermination factor NusG
MKHETAAAYLVKLHRLQEWAPSLKNVKIFSHSLPTFYPTQAPRFEPVLSAAVGSRLKHLRSPEWELESQLVTGLLSGTKQDGFRFLRFDFRLFRGKRCASLSFGTECAIQDVCCRQELAWRQSGKARISQGAVWDSEGEAMSSLQENQFASADSTGVLSANQPRWYAVQTRARHELRIGRELQQRGIRGFVPTLREAHQWSDRTKVLEVPLFSCYVFVNLEASAAQHLEVLKMPGVYHFVRVNGAPAPIPDSQIESMQAVFANNLQLSSCSFLQIGQKVRIRGGALDGVEGILAANKGAHKLVISVDLLQQSLEVTVEGYAIEPI